MELAGPIKAAATASRYLLPDSTDVQNKLTQAIAFALLFNALHNMSCKRLTQTSINTTGALLCWTLKDLKPFNDGVATFTIHIKKQQQQLERQEQYLETLEKLIQEKTAQLETMSTLISDMTALKEGNGELLLKQAQSVGELRGEVKSLTQFRDTLQEEVSNLREQIKVLGEQLKEMGKQTQEMGKQTQEMKEHNKTLEGSVRDLTSMSPRRPGLPASWENPDS